MTPTQLPMLSHWLAVDQCPILAKLSLACRDVICETRLANALAGCSNSSLCRRSSSTLPHTCIPCERTVTPTDKLRPGQNQNKGKVQPWLQYRLQPYFPSWLPCSVWFLPVNTTGEPLEFYVFFSNSFSKVETSRDAKVFSKEAFLTWMVLNFRH